MQLLEVYDTLFYDYLYVQKNNKPKEKISKKEKHKTYI